VRCTFANVSSEDIMTCHKVIYATQRIERQRNSSEEVQGQHKRGDEIA
jgi:hypothetical protein